MRTPKTTHAAVAAPTPAKRPGSAAKRKLTVAVTGPTGQIGRPFIAALERAPQVGRVIGMARRPFDPARHGWKKLEYRQGDIRDRDALDALVAGADVVAHLAFIVFAGRGASREINLAGSRNVFQAAVAAKAKRLIFTSSVAAYGFHDDAPALLTEDVPARGTERLRTRPRRPRSRPSWYRRSRARTPRRSFCVRALSRARTREPLLSRSR